MTWWNQIPEIHKVGAAILAIIITLFLAGVSFGAFIGLPDRVETVEGRVERLEAGQSEILRGIGRTNCYLDNLVEGSPQKRCP